MPILQRRCGATPTIRALALFVIAVPLHAQSAGVPARSFAVAFVADRMDRRDEIVSPARYGGTLSGWRLGYAGEWAGHRTGVALEFATGTLTGALNAQSREEMYDAALDVSHVRRVRSLFVGAAMRFRVTALEHYYGNPTLADDFGLASLSLSPTVEWDPARVRNVRVRASSPLVTLLARPYSRVNVVRGRPRFRLAAPWDARALALDVSHQANATRRVALRTAYTLELQSLREAYGLAAVENRLTVAGVFRFGRAP